MTTLKIYTMSYVMTVKRLFLATVTLWKEHMPRREGFSCIFIPQENISPK